MSISWKIDEIAIQILPHSTSKRDGAMRIAMWENDEGVIIDGYYL